ncbi:hypothetical protein J8137_20950, partial [Lactiplantibacillus plantarum]|nr:hypothetical protein [Lactiplantibacillus plantarum]
AAIYAHKHYPNAQDKRAVATQLKQIAALTNRPLLNVDYFNDTVGYYQTVTSQLVKLDWHQARIYLAAPTSIAMANIRSVSIANQS